MTYTLWAANDLLVASKLNLMSPTLITQGADQEILASQTLRLSDVIFSPALNAVYQYELYLCYTASTAADISWNWEADQATFSRYVTHRAFGAVSGFTTGSDAVIRRPGMTTQVGAQGADVSGTTAPVNFTCAFDRGTFSTGSTPAIVGLNVANGNQTGTPDADEPTIVRGGNATRMIVTRIG